MYLNDGIQRSVSSYVLDVKVVDIEGNHVKEVSYVGKMSAKNRIMCCYTEMTIDR